MKIKEANDIILDCFGGADGGVGFARYKFWSESLEQDNKEAAKDLILLITRYAKLIDVIANRNTKL